MQDSALLHVAPLTLRDVRGRRISAASCPYSKEAISHLLEDMDSTVVDQGSIKEQATRMAIFLGAPEAERLLRRMERKGWKRMETSSSDFLS